MPTVQKKLAACILMFAGLLALPGCGEKPDPHTIDVYSPHGADLEGDIKKRFELANPGWTVRFQDMGGAEILGKIRAEKDRPRASVWWGGAVSDFKRAEKEQLLALYVPAWSDTLPAEAKSPSGGWSATFVTPEIILFNPNKIAKADVPTDWDGLIDAKWKGRIAIRDAYKSTGMQLIFGALILREKARKGSVDAGFEFLKKLDANKGSGYAPNPDAMYKLLEDDGPYALAPWNLPDVLLQQQKKKPFDYVLPKETMVNIEPIAILKNAPSPEGAKLFYDFVCSREQLVMMANQRHRIPARKDILPDKLPLSMQNVGQQTMKYDRAEFDANIEEWMARWDEQVKGKGGK